jgi:ubiquinone/menaquinone biosynthesis C-methylase UbiE
MGFYRDRILPHLINLSMGQKRFSAYRSRVVPAAEGRVLEIGIGTGLNLPLYPAQVEQVIGLDPSPRLLAMARRVSHPGFGHVEFIDGSAEEIPLEDASVDTVLTTWTLCSIPDVSRALGEMRRVLRPDGRLLFRRTRPRAGSQRRVVAGPPDSGLEANRRRLPPQSYN